MKSSEVSDNTVVVSTLDGRYSIEITKDLLNDVAKTIKHSGLNETGGVIVGYYSTDQHTAIVTSFEPPPKDSKASRFSFQRGTKGLLKRLQSLWRLKARQYYLGEWHRHPFGDCSASSVDLEDIKKIARNPDWTCPQPILMIFVLDNDKSIRFSVNIAIRGAETLYLGTHTQDL